MATGVCQPAVGNAPTCDTRRHAMCGVNAAFTSSTGLRCRALHLKWRRAGLHARARQPCRARNLKCLYMGPKRPGTAPRGPPRLHACKHAWYYSPITECSTHPSLPMRIMPFSGIRLMHAWPTRLMVGGSCMSSALSLARAGLPEQLLWSLSGGSTCGGDMHACKEEWARPSKRSLVGSLTAVSTLPTPATMDMADDEVCAAAAVAS